MAMPNPPRPKRFQFHLSTAIVLMFVAGGLIWANANGRRVDGQGVAFKNDPLEWHDDITESEFFAQQRFQEWYGDRRVERGWPINAMQTGEQVYIDRDGRREKMVPIALPSVWRTALIIANALIALAILFAVWFLCEWVIRRRTARKGA
ncbi:MAG TPA: hypothetical protein VKX17_14955 [Planctomycetota bacterium]|nr:hypothetical protein [Planctomycetota bacterium]